MSSNTLFFLHNQVQKRYRSRISYDRELMLLTMLAGTGLVPEIQHRGQNTLTLTCVEGPTLLELLEKVWAGDMPPKEGERLLHLLADWVCTVQKHLLEQNGRTIALQDPHLRNFIFNESSGTLMGLDFEHWHYGMPEETPAMLLTFLDGYRGAQSKTAKKLYDGFRMELITRLSIEPSALFQIEERCRRRLLLRRSTAEQRRYSTAVILAGGRSLRMGKPKQNLSADGYTFLERTLDTLDSFDYVAVSGGKASYPELTVPVWEDMLPDCGPMGGLLTALSRTKTPLVFLTACDTPDLSESLIYHLYEALLPKDECLVPVADGRIHPLAGIYSTKLLPQVEQLVKSHDYRMRSLLDVVNTHYIPLSAEFSLQLSNINTPLEYNEWQTRQFQKITF